MKAADVSRDVAFEAIGHLRALFGEPASHGALQAALAVTGLVEDPQAVALRCAVLAAEVLSAIE